MIFDPPGAVPIYLWQRVLAAVRKMSYVPNANAGSLVRKSTSTIAVLVPDITNTFFTTLVRGIEDKANESGLSVILGNTDEEPQKEQTYIRKFLASMLVHYLAELGHRILHGQKPSKDVGLELTRRLVRLDPRPTAIFAANNSLAAGSVMALQQAGLSVPQDLSIACFDDNDANSFNPFFTSVIQPAYIMGCVAAEILQKRFKSEQKSPANRLVMQPEMVIRRSTAKPV